jgi:hypothetical protein
VALWLVVLGRVELELSQQFAVVGEDPDVELVDQDEEVGAGVAAALLAPAATRRPPREPTSPNAQADPADSG